MFYSNVILPANEKHATTTLKIVCDVNTRENPCKKSNSATIEFKQALEKPTAHLRVSEMQNNHTFLEKSYDVCVVEKMPALAVIINYYREAMKESTNFTLGCPIPKGNYYVKSILMSRLDMLTSLFPLHKKYKIAIDFNNDFGSGPENVFLFSYDFEMIDID